MTKSKDLLNFEKLVNLFFLLVIGTTAFVILSFWEMPAYPWKEGLELGLLLIGIFSFEVVIVSLLS
ncbi:MAG: hypothetical protein ACOCUR_02325, partial [Nanoarchaeota archaeon]